MYIYDKWSLYWMTSAIVIKFALSFCGLQFWELWFFDFVYQDISNVFCMLYAVHSISISDLSFLGQDSQCCPIDVIIEAYIVCFILAFCSCMSCEYQRDRWVEGILVTKTRLRRRVLIDFIFLYFDGVVLYSFVRTFFNLCWNCCYATVCSAVSRQGQVAPRTGFMYNFQQRETLIKVWDPVTEGIPSLL